MIKVRQMSSSLYPGQVPPLRLHGSLMLSLAISAGPKCVSPSCVGTPGGMVVGRCAIRAIACAR